MRRIPHLFAAISLAALAAPTAAFGLACPADTAPGGGSLTPAPGATIQGVSSAGGSAADGGIGGTYDAVPPNLMVKIPGLVFAEQVPVESKTQALQIPYLAQYVAAAYRYLVGIAAIAAGIMVVYGGLLYLLGETVGSASKGKAYIQDALVGLLILFSAVAILRVVGVEQGLRSLTVPRVKPDPFAYLGGNQDAPATLSQVGISPRSGSVDPESIQQGGARTGDPDAVDTTGARANPAEARPSGGSVKGNEYVPPKSTAKFPTDLTIPVSCPGRDPKYDTGVTKIGGVLDFNPKNYTLCSKGKCLDETIIKKYLEEQARTGIPAGVLMAQMLTEAGPCGVIHLFDDPSVCGGQFNNFGGIGCTQGQVPANTCAHTAFPDGFIQRGGSGKVSGTCDNTDQLAAGNGGPNRHNNAVSPVCGQTCASAGTAQQLATTINCGPNCYPQISHASVLPFGANGPEVWYQSVQCSRKFKDATEFLQNHLGFVKYCLPYNDSVYKFAYCIGASTYAGSTGLKGPALAEIIERNCLCGSNDSSGCRRDKALEEKLAKNVIQKTNFYKLPRKCLDCDAQGKCLKYAPFSEPDYNAVAKALKDKAGLDPRTYMSNDDIGISRLEQ